MNVEFHYYITYIVARFAGCSHLTSKTIAYSSQYVDDNIDEYNVICPMSLTAYPNTCSSSYSPVVCQEVLKMHLCHHFIPGDNLKNPLIVTADSILAQKLVARALVSSNPYLIGIALHAYTDTWAHQNFIGNYEEHNSSGTLWGKFIPSIGHADFGPLPRATALKISFKDRAEGVIIPSSGFS